MQNRQHNLETAWLYDRDRVKKRLKEFYNFTTFRRTDYAKAISNYSFPNTYDDLSIAVESTTDADADDWENLDDEDDDDDLVSERSYSVASTRRSSMKKERYSQIVRPNRRSSLKQVSYSSFDDQSQHYLQRRQRRETSTLSPSDFSHATGKEASSKQTARTSYSTIETTDDMTNYSWNSSTSSIHDLKVKKRMMERTFDRRYAKFPGVVELAMTKASPRANTSTTSSTRKNKRSTSRVRPSRLEYTDESEWV